MQAQETLWNAAELYAIENTTPVRSPYWSLDINVPEHPLHVPLK